MNNVNLTRLEKSLNYIFNNKDLLIEAITHPSLKQYEYNKYVKDYERLEFLGDAILSFVISEELFKNNQNFQEGDLAKNRSYLVCKQTISSVAINKLSLSEYMIMTTGEEVSHGRENISNIENVMEALIAAIYLDSQDINIVKDIINSLWFEYLHKSIDFTSFDPKSTLQELVQAHKQAVIYEVTDKIGPAHAPIFTVKVKAMGHTAVAKALSIKEAEKLAAKQLLQIIK